MKLTVRILRQRDSAEAPGWVSHELEDLESSLSILDLLDILNEELISKGEVPVSFESDCREGICGACGLMVNGFAQGPVRNLPACHQRLSSFQDGETISLSPFSAGAFPVIADLMVARSSLDQVLAAGGTVAVDTGTAPDAESLPVGQVEVETALNFAACTGCGACVAACPNGSAQLYLGAKLNHLALLPLPSKERSRRAKAMVHAADELFGPCSSYGECALACPAGIPLSAIAAVNHERLRAVTRISLGGK